MMENGLDDSPERLTPCRDALRSDSRMDVVRLGHLRRIFLIKASYAACDPIQNHVAVSPSRMHMARQWIPILTE